MKSSLTEGKFLLHTVGAIFLLMALYIFQPQLYEYYNPKDYLGIHMILEFFSISISVTIFLYGLKSFGTTRSSKMLYLSFIFFLIGTIDLLHTLSFKGMPHFFTDSSIAKATWFWVIARVMESVFMLVLIIFPNRKLKRDYRGLVLVSAVTLAFLAAIFVVHYEKSLPLLVIEGTGTTFLKNMIEYSVSFLQFLSIIIMLYQYFIEKEGGKLSITLAFVFLLFSELIFTTYQSVYDLENLTGHLFKAIGYYFILKSFYFTEPISEIDKLTYLVSEHPGFIFKLEVRRNECTCTFCEGELLANLGFVSKEIIPKGPQNDIFKILGHSVEDYCLSKGTGQDHKTFEINYKNKTLLVSVKRLFESEGIRTIIGTVIELHSIQNTEAYVIETKQADIIRTEKISQFFY